MIGRRGVIQLQLDEIRNPNCTACPLHVTEGNVCVMGRGSVVAPIMLVGEAPGEAEAKTGKPFMGLSGQYMNEVLEELDMQHMVYITNLAKCRPMKNRQPLPPEWNKCTELYLEPEVNVIRPKVMVIMSRAGIKYIMGGGRNPFQRFHLYSKNTRDWWISAVILGWHPSYVLRTGYAEDIAKEFKFQFQLAKDYVEGKVKPTQPNQDLMWKPKKLVKREKRAEARAERDAEYHRAIKLLTTGEE